MRLRQPGRALRGLPICRECRLGVPQRFPGLAQPEPGLGEIRPQPGGLLQAGGRFLRSCTEKKRTAEIVLRRRIRGLKAYGLLQWTEGVGQAARLSETRGGLQQPCKSVAVRSGH